MSAWPSQPSADPAPPPPGGPGPPDTCSARPPGVVPGPPPPSHAPLPGLYRKGSGGTNWPCGLIRPIQQGGLEPLRALGTGCGPCRVHPTPGWAGAAAAPQVAPESGNRPSGRESGCGGPALGRRVSRRETWKLEARTEVLVGLGGCCAEAEGWGGRRPWRGGRGGTGQGRGGAGAPQRQWCAVSQLSVWLLVQAQVTISGIHAVEPCVGLGVDSAAPAWAPLSLPLPARGFSLSLSVKINELWRNHRSGCGSAFLGPVPSEVVKRFPQVSLP